MLQRVVVALLLGAVACSKESVLLDGRVCTVNADCLPGFVCNGGFCDTPGDSPIDEVHYTRGATFVVDVSMFGPEITDFPVLMILDGTRLQYDRIREDRSNLRFFDVSTGFSVPYDVASWNRGGTSQIWLLVDRLAGPREFVIAYGDEVVEAPADNGWAENDFVAVYHFEPGAEGTDSSGVAGALSDTPTVTAADANGIYVSQSATTVQALRPASTTGDLTVEVTLAPTAGAWANRYDVQLDPPTPVDEYQVSVPFASNDGYAIALQGALLPTWTEPLAAGTVELWTRVPSTGTSALTLYAGATAPVPEAGFESVLDSGISYVVWDVTGSFPTSTAASVEAFFNGFDRANALAFDRVDRITCTQDRSLTPCPIMNIDRRAAIFYGWLVVPTDGVRKLGTQSDDLSDIAIGPGAWSPGAAITASVYAYAPAGAIASTGIWTFNTQPQRFRYRYSEATGGEAYIASMAPATQPTLTTADAIPMSRYRTRKLVQFPPVPSRGEPVILGEALTEAGDLSITGGVNLVRVAVGGARLDAPVKPTSRKVTVTVAGTNATLYIDGAFAAEGTMAQPLATTGRQLRIGDVQADPLSRAPTIDELRFATVARSAEWIAAQAANTNAGLVHFQ